MTLLKIVKWPAKVLETPASKVTVFDENLKIFTTDMHETMAASGGVGLAANQVNDLRRIITICIPWFEPKVNDEDPASDTEQEGSEKKEWWHDKRFTFVNPTIVKTEGRCRGQEGCLSFPGTYEMIERFLTCDVKAQDEMGSPFEIHATGLFAICLQHEIDHINGVVFLKHMSRLKAGLIKRKLARQKEFDEGDLEL